MSFKPHIGLRGKLSILIGAAVLGIAAILTIYTSRYLSDAINQEYRHRAEMITSFFEANLDSSGNKPLASRMQSEIDVLMQRNKEVKKISVYALTDGGIKNIASSDRAQVGLPAGSADAAPLTSGAGSEFTDTCSDDGPAAAGAATTAGAPQNDPDPAITRNDAEMVAPILDPENHVIASVGVYLDTAPRDSLIRSQQIRVALITNVGLLALLALLYFSLNRFMVHPVKKLTGAARRMSKEDYRQPPALGRKDEIGVLAQEFKRLSTSLKSRDEEVSLLLDTSAAVSSTLHVNRILQILCDKIASSRRVTYCRIAMLEPESGCLVVEAAAPTRSNMKWDYGIGQRMDLGEAVNHRKVLETGKPVLLKIDDKSMPVGGPEREWALTPETQSALLLPLHSKKEVVGVVILGETRSWERTPFSGKKIELYQTLMNQASVAIDNARLYEKTEWHVQELSAMHNISQAFTSTLNYQEVISVVANKVGNLIGAQFASVLLPDENRRHLNIVASYNLSAEYIWSINKKRRVPVGAGPLGKSFSSQAPVIVKNVLTDPAYEQWKSLASMQGYSSLIALPLVAKGQGIGVICIYFTEPRDLNMSEVELLTTSANEAAIAIENSRMFENLQDAFIGTIRSLAETIDAKDTYTRGHSERVSLYSEAIARTLGLSDDEIVTIRYAGYLHDVGKIGIPDQILRKPGKLSMEEYQIIKKHPVLSERILKPVGFPFPVQPIVRHHHERFDGRGYPDGLTAEEIPLGARILFVADAFEAMTSDRPYRKALSVDRALSELSANRGTQFDPRVVDALIRVIDSGDKSDDEEMKLGA